MPFNCIMIGDEALAAECGRQVLASGHNIRALISDNPMVMDWAQAQGISVIAPGPGLETRLAGLSAEMAPDWLFNIAALRILPRAVLALPSKGCINFHDGPLPQHAGLNAPAWAILSGETRHAVTWHLMTDGVDQGDILLEQGVNIAPDDTTHTLNAKCFASGIDSFATLLAGLEDGQLTPRPQAQTGRRLHRLTDRPANDGHLDPARPAQDLHQQVRALTHGPHWNPLTTPKLLLGGQIVVIGHARLLPGQGKPGQVLAVDAEGLTLACGDGALRLSGLLCQQGLPLDPTFLAQAGDMLTPPPQGLDTALRQIRRREQHWRDALRAMVPARLASEPLGHGASSPATAMLNMPDTPDHVLIASFARAVRQFLPQHRFDLALRLSAMADAEAIAGAHVSGWVPLAVDTDNPDLADQIAATLQIANMAPGFPGDISARDPELGLITPPDIAVTDGADMPGAALVLDLAAHALHYDPARLAPARVQAVLDQMRGIPAIPETHTSPAEASARVAYPRQCLHHAFEAQVTRSPQAPALVFEDITLTYAELNARANRVAHVLLTMGVTPDMPVALCAARGPNLLIGALGILKAGGAYVPLDPAYPGDRLAHYLADSGAPILVSEHALLDSLPAHDAQLLQLDTDTRLAQASPENPQTQVTPDHLAYLIYTSGSTGQPKGVMVEHRNLANFLVGMDDRITHEPPGVWLAVTSLNFDISVLELFWTLARGFKLVLMGTDDVLPAPRNPVQVSEGQMQFSLMYWGNDDGPGPQKYQLLLEGAKFADTHGFTAIWTPERHFHAFGGPFPNPAVTGAAVASVTRNLAVRAGSCVAPLHHPIRIAEDWAVIDNLTNGRAGMGLASGWHPVDFVLKPENRPPHNKQALFDTVDTLRRLWRGEEVAFDKGDGVMIPVQTLPRPVSRELPLWLTTAGNPETWRDAGRIGAHVLTHLLGQSIEEVAEKITIYHDALRAAGHDPADFTVTLMLHTFVARDREHARRVAEAPMKAYLQAAAGLVKQYAWAFPAFKRPQGVQAPVDIDLGTLSQDEVDGILEFAFDRYFNDSGLFGTVEDCMARVEQLKAIGVTEIACLIDYGIAAEQVLEGLYPLAEVLQRTNAGTAPAQDDFSIAAQIRRHKVTHLQCTPSLARMMLGCDTTRAALAQVPHLMLGGEALPGKLAQDLSELTGTPVQNMYGPTETTIWSSSRLTSGGSGIVGLGQPIANTEFHVVDDTMQPCPPGQEGELLIGGDGVTRGYWNRPDLTAARFIPNPFGTGKVYRTGDKVRRNATGDLEFLGRVDDQVKIRGHRIEPGEIESVLESIPGIRAAVVIAREDRPGDQRLVAYYTGNPATDLRAALARHLPAHMQPAHLVPLAALPLTPNRKIDRKALPAPTAATPPEPASTGAPGIAETGVAETGGAPATPLARRIATIWAGVLGVEQIGPRDNFFHLGGHSLLAVQAHREMRETLELPGLSITDLFRFPVLDDLAQHLARRAQPAAITPLHPEAATPPVPPQAPTSKAASPAVAPPATDRMPAINRRRAMRARNGIAS